MATANSAAGGPAIDRKINYDIDFIKANISANTNPAILENLKTHFSIGHTRGLSGQNRDLFETVSNSNHNVFLTMHGTPILAPELSSIAQPIFQVPAGCMIVMVAPPGTVVYGGEDEDMCSFRYFKQRNWPAANASGAVETCYGAERSASSIVVDEDQASEYDSREEDEESPETIAERVHQRHEEVREKIQEKVDQLLEKRALRSGDCSEEMKTELKNELERLSRLGRGNPYGNEILENIQVFFPGDWVYNQFQEWEYDAQHSGDVVTRGYDLNFDIYNLGLPVNTYDETFTRPHNMPAGIDLTHTHGNETRLAIQYIGEACNVEDFRTPVSFVNNLSPRLKHAFGPTPVRRLTTQFLIYELMKDNQPKMIVLNSCSPYRKAERTRSHPGLPRHADPRYSISNAANLLLRNYLMTYGRKSFCRLRGYCSSKPDIDLSRVVVPQYDEHRGITVAFHDDREDFYVTLGNIIKSAKLGALLFTPSLFKTFLDLCDKSDKSGKLLKTFKRIYEGFLSHQGSIASKQKFNLQSFDGEIYLIEQERIGISRDTILQNIPSAGEGKQMDMGGGRKKYRRKKKRKNKKTKKKKRKNRKNKKKKRTKRKHGGGKGKKQKKTPETKSVESVEAVAAAAGEAGGKAAASSSQSLVMFNPYDENDSGGTPIRTANPDLYRKHIEEWHKGRKNDKEIRKMVGEQHNRTENLHGSPGSHKKKPKRKKKTRKKQKLKWKAEGYGDITVTSSKVDDLYKLLKSNGTFKGGNKKKGRRKNKTRKKRGGQLIWPPVIGTVVKRRAHPNILLYVVRIVQNDLNPNNWEVGLRQNNRTPILFRNKEFYMTQYKFVGFDPSNPNGMPVKL